MTQPINLIFRFLQNVSFSFVTACLLCVASRLTRLCFVSSLGDFYGQRLGTRYRRRSLATGRAAAGVGCSRLGLRFGGSLGVGAWGHFFAADADQDLALRQRQHVHRGADRGACKYAVFEQGVGPRHSKRTFFSHTALSPGLRFYPEHRSRVFYLSRMCAWIMFSACSAWGSLALAPCFAAFPPPRILGLRRIHELGS